MKYRVLRNCYGFMGRGWMRDEIVEIDPSLHPPIHFKPLEIPFVPEAPARVAPEVKKKPKRSK